MKITRYDFVNKEAHEYHLRSNNSPWLLRNPAIRQLNYNEKIVELFNDGPRKIDIDDARRTVALLRDETPVQISLEDAILKRDSSREFSATALSISKLSKLLAMANGLKKSVNSSAKDGRNVPSAGGLGSCEIYVLSLNADSVLPGLYHYDVNDHLLNPLKFGNFRTWVERMVLLQPELAACGVLIFLASNQSRLMQKYGSRSYRLGLLDAGHVSQNIYLVATGLNLSVTATGGFIDDAVNTGLRLDGLHDCVVLVLAVGEKKE